MSGERFDDAVVGAGIVGLAHAYQLASLGRRVVVFERNRSAQGASVRNFGMLWPIGQPAGVLRTLALRSREIWLDVLMRAGIWHERVGSLHVAYEEDEACVLAEFASEARESGFCCELVDPATACAQSPFLRLEGLRSALWSPHETCVDPRIVLRALPTWLATSLRVRFEFNTHITSCEPPSITAGERRWRADRVWICGGDDLQTLFPETLQQQHLVRCKLQMMRSCPVPSRMSWCRRTAPANL
jgi:FAD dependent oxidoreductase TIGR03364